MKHSSIKNSKYSKKKAQIKFGETFGIIILVYILIVAGMIWYNKVASNNIAEIQEKDNRDKAFEKYYYVINSDMLHKSQLGVTDEEFDLSSLKIFYEYSRSDENKEHIRKQIGESTILVEIVDKDFNGIENLTLYNKTPTEIKTKESFKTLIPIEDPIEDVTYIGKLTVIVYD